MSSKVSNKSGTRRRGKNELSRLPDPHLVRIAKQPSFVPPRMRQTLRYAEEYALTGTSGAIGFNALALNGAFDPNTTGAGHQPMGFDQYMAMYTRACVVATRVTAEFILNGTTVPTIVAITGAATSTLWSTGTGRIESGLSSYKLLPPDCSVPVTLTAAYDIRSLSGVKDILDEPDLWCTSSANPATILGCQVWARDVNGTSTVSVQCLVVVEYDIVFLQPATIVQS